MGCYVAVSRLGERECWTIPEDMAESLRLTPTEKRQQANTRGSNPTRKLVRLVGATYTAEVCAVDVGTVCEWFEAGTPSAMCEPVETELQRVRRERARRSALGYGGRCDDSE